MPIDLKDFPSTQPIPTGAVQKCEGNNNVGNNFVQGQVLQRGAGGDMRVAVQPGNNCDWFVYAHYIYMGVTGLWSRSDACISISPADRYGKTECNRVAFRGHNTVSWQSVVLGGSFQLVAGTIYNAYLWCPYTEPTVNNYYCGGNYLKMFGYTVGEGYLG